MKFCPYEKGRGRTKVLAMLKGGTTSFSHIAGGLQKVSTL